MNPLLISALVSMLPSLLGGMGVFGQDPKKKLQNQIMQLLNPSNVQALTQKIYQGNISSPAYSQAQGAIAQGANQASSQLASSLGARGIGATGTGAVLSSLTPSLVGSQTAGLRTSAFTSAQDQAQKQIDAQIAALTGTSGPSQNMNLFSGGLAALGPLLQQWINSKYPTLQAAK